MWLSVGAPQYLNYLIFNDLFGEHGSSPNLKDVMMFLTGCNSVPPLGFGSVSPSIQFSEDGV